MIALIDLIVAIWVYFFAGLVIFIFTVGFLAYLFHALQDEHDNTNTMKENENEPRPRIYNDRG